MTGSGKCLPPQICRGHQDEKRGTLIVLICGQPYVQHSYPNHCTLSNLKMNLWNSWTIEMEARKKGVRWFNRTLNSSVVPSPCAGSVIPHRNFAPFFRSSFYQYLLLNIICTLFYTQSKNIEANVVCGMHVVCVCFHLYVHACMYVSGVCLSVIFLGAYITWYWNSTNINQVIKMPELFDWCRTYNKSKIILPDKGILRVQSDCPLRHYFC